MKKLILLGMASFIGLVSQAQYKNQQLIDLPETPVPTVQKKLNPAKLAEYKMKQNEERKKTRATSVWYNIADYMAATAGILPNDLYSFQQSFGGTNPNGRMVYNYLWPDSTMRFGAATAQGITFQSVGQVLDPTSKTFTQQLQAPDVEIGMGNAYKVDSFQLFCSYNRNANQAAVVDTLILSFVVEDNNNLPVSGWTSGNVVTNFGADTVTFLAQDFDSLNSKPPVQRNIGGGGAPVIIKKVLDIAAANDTIAGGWNLYKFAPNINVPAGRAVSVSVSFKPGTNWVPFVDSIADFNNFLFVSHEENLAGFFTYTKWDFNSSNVVTKFSNYIGNPQGWGGTYLPALAYTAPYQYEFHNMDWKLDCPTCGVAGATNYLKDNIKYTVSPNPASDVLNFSFNMNIDVKAASISLTNLVGQQVKNIEIGKVNAQTTQNVNMNVSDLAPGLYIYTFHADGQQLSNKVLVK